MLNRTYYLNKWYAHGREREGEKLTVYLDTVDIPTVGIGHRVLKRDKLKVGDKITKKRSQEFFMQDTRIAEKAALKQIKEMGLEDIPGANDFMVALISVNFQLGIDWYKKFYSTYPAIVRGNYAQAIHNLKKSKWYKQTPVRVKDFIAALKALPEKDSHLDETRPLRKTRTMQGGALATTSLIASETVTEVKDQIEPLVPYAEYLQTAFVILALVGIVLTIYARVDDRKRGLR